MLVIYTGEDTVDLRNAICLNTTAQLLFQKLTEGKDREELVNLLISNYNIAEEQAIKDVDEFISNIKAKGLLEDNEKRD